MKTSQILSMDLNNNKVGKYGGTSAAKIVQPGDNQLHAVHSEESVKEELSEASAKYTPENGVPDRELFEASK